MRLLTVAGPVSLLLAGCGDAGDAMREQPDPAAAPVEKASGGSDADRTDDWDWTGDWAASPAMCRDGWWRLARDGIVTAGETTCTVKSERVELDRAVVLDLACTAEGRQVPERWILEPQGTDRMTVTRVSGGNVVDEVALGRCG